MKIDSRNNTPAAARNGAPPATDSGDEQNAVAAVRPDPSAAAQNAAVNLSSMSALRTSSAPDIDSALVEAVKAALRDGSYQIDSGMIADGMLSSARELLQTRSR
jgi:negative regulator of flagellin synthesis FlgM